MPFFGDSFIPETWEMCDPNFDYAFKAYGWLKKVGEEYFVSGNVTLKQAAGDHLQVTGDLDLLTDKGPVRIISAVSNQPCTDAHRLGNIVVYDIERRIGLVPGLCPIPPGKYYVNDYPLNNYKLLAIPALPTGKGNATGYVRDPKTNRILACAKISGEHLP